MPAPTTGPSALWFVRHGESVANVADRAAHASGSGRIEVTDRDADVRLSDDGRAQAAAVGAWFASLPADERPQLVLASPYERTHRTAESVAQALGLPVLVDERLRERDLGWLDGLTWVGVQQRYPDEAERRAHLGKFYYRPPGGECWADVALRVRQLVREWSTDLDGQRVVVVSHQAVVMVVRYVLEGMSEAQVLEADAGTQVANCGVTSYERQDGALVLRAFNTTHQVAAAGGPVTEEPDAEPA